MSSNCDPGDDIITAVITTFKSMYDVGLDCPPVGGALSDTGVVHFLPGDAALWDPLVGEGDGCDDPFLWVRLMSRFRTSHFPEPEVLNTCTGVDVLHLELGVGRCVNIDPGIDYTILATEAEWGLDDSWRLDRTICLLRGVLQKDVMIASEPITPSGPDGGGLVWTVVLYIGITS